MRGVDPGTRRVRWAFLILVPLLLVGLLLKLASLAIRLVLGLAFGVVGLSRRPAAARFAS